MEIKTFRAKTMQQALNLVRQELGTEATVLHTRELNSNLLGRMFLGRQYEIAASSSLQVPTRIAQPVAVTPDYSARYRQDFQQQRDDGLQELHALASQLQQRSLHTGQRQLPETLFEVYTDLIEADIEETVAQELVDRLRHDQGLDPLDESAFRDELARMLESELRVAGPITASAGQGRIVALVGPTGVGKTTTIAKLAANYRLRENKRVGLITVDTYRIAAVEQLRTYAEIIDLPMEVVSTPREMREAKARMRDLDLVLMDTAGRSPRDEVRIQELKSMLAEAAPAEVHLVLSAVGSASSLATTAERFAAVGTTAMIVTKLDEATTLGNLVTLTRSCRLPMSYLTDGQNVPDDIQIAQSRTLAQLILGVKN
jgi:flagellar biosynthesis protein FlhF